MTAIQCLAIIALSLVAVVFIAYRIAEVLSGAISDRGTALFSARCSTSLKGMGVSWPLGSVALYETRLSVTGWGRCNLEYEYICDIVTGFSIESLFGPPWWKTLHIRHTKPAVTSQVYVIMSRHKAREFLRLLSDRMAAAHAALPQSLSQEGRS